MTRDIRHSIDYDEINASEILNCILPQELLTGFFIERAISLGRGATLGEAGPENGVVMAWGGANKDY